MKLWIDDLRPAPEGYTWAKSVEEVKIHCTQYLDPNKNLHIEEFNLDHDSGNYYYLGGDYIEILKFLEEKQYFENWKINSVFHIHSQNPVGVQNMRAIIQKNNWKEIR